MSTTNTMVSVPLTPMFEFPSDPYPLSGGITRSTCDPTVWPTRPSSHAGITPPLPIGKSAGAPRRPRRVERLAGAPDRPRVVRGDRLAGLDDRAGALDQRLHHQVGRRVALRDGDGRLPRLGQLHLGLAADWSDRLALRPIERRAHILEIGNEQQGVALLDRVGLGALREAFLRSDRDHHATAHRRADQVLHDHRHRPLLVEHERHRRARRTRTRARRRCDR